MSSPSPPRPQPSTPAPKETDKEVQEAISEATRRRRLGQGYRSTILRNMATNPASLKTTFGA